MMGELPWQENHEIICKPTVLANATASVIHGAVEAAVPELAVPGIRAYLRKRPFCIINDCPDNARSMRKRQKKAMQELQDEDGALYAAFGCAAHKVHRIVVSSSEKSKTFLGDIHAVAFALSINSHQNLVQRSLWHYIETRLHITHVPTLVR
eukprot:8718592-Lingulodinium_polyedra.AAC.2